MPELPALLRQSVAERVTALQQREFDLMAKIREPYETVLRTWREEVERAFLSTFVISLDPAAKQQVWDPTAVPTIEERLIEPLDEAITQTEDALLDELEEDEEDAYRLGLLYGLWDLSLTGEDVDDYEMPDRSEVRRRLGLLAFLGLPLAARLRVWGDTYVQKTRQALRGSVVQGSTLPQTLEQLDLIQRGLPAHVASLGANETFRAFTHGGKRILEDFETAISGWLWLTQRDERVCTICAPLHMTITTLTPVDNTHPDCRCMVVPIPLRYTPTPSAFAAFSERFA